MIMRNISSREEATLATQRLQHGFQEARSASMCSASQFQLLAPRTSIEQAFERIGKNFFKDATQREAFEWMEQQREHCCIVMPTGSGKSLFFELSAILNNCCNIVFCPLVLLHVQVQKLNSEFLCVMTWTNIHSQGMAAAASKCNILVMPFEMNSSDSRIIFFLQQLERIGRLGRCFVDEAHSLLEDENYRSFDAFWSLSGSAKSLVKYVTKSSISLF
jgi:superfamily II DNA helicase RecQ